MKTIVTHSSNFHADELFGTAALIAYNKKKFPKDTIKVIRSLDPKVWEKADFLLDIGGVYAPAKNRFDHHQRGGAGQHGNSIPYAAFGLVWKKFGKAISGSQKAADYVEKKLVMALDGDDNGNMMYEPVIDDILPVTLEEYVTLERGIEKNRTGMKDLNSLDKKFKSLLPFAERVINLFVEKAGYKIQAEKNAQKIYKAAKDKRIMIMKKFIGFNFSRFPEPLVTVYPELRGNGWSAKVVSDSDVTDSSKNRITFPAAWRGREGADMAKASGIADAVFCHNSGFMVSAKSKEGVLELVKKAIAQK